MRISIPILPHKIASSQNRLLYWAQQFEYCCLLNSNHYAQDEYHEYEWILAAGSKNHFTYKQNQSNPQGFELLKAFLDKQHSEVLGFIGYDMKNELETLYSKNRDFIGFPDIFFFEPLHRISIQNNCLTWETEQPISETEILSIINTIDDPQNTDFNKTVPIEIKQRLTKNEYIEKINAIKQHIQAGDIYEMNFCQEFYSTDIVLNPVVTYLKLNQASPMPFSAFFKWNQCYALCASPERFIRKQGSNIISQPIKGTIRRGNTAAEDAQLMAELYNNPKERAENVMIVDLVRNDLSRTAAKGSVKVKELFGIYTFPQVHQMISTIEAKIKEENLYLDAIKHAFPMGSMTGAPKIRAMQLIEDYESTKRGLYSGCIGYFTPDKDFDFNVVIRSIQYNAVNKYLSFITGGAITINAAAESEYDECLLKAKAMIKILQNVT